MLGCQATENDVRGFFLALTLVAMANRKKPSDSKLREAFAARLKAARLSDGKFPNKIDLARAIGQEGETYNRYERGEVEPNIATLRRIAKELRITVDYLVGADIETAETIATVENLAKVSLPLTEGTSSPLHRKRAN